MHIALAIMAFLLAALAGVLCAMRVLSQRQWLRRQRKKGRRVKAHGDLITIGLGILCLLCVIGAIALLCSQPQEPETPPDDTTSTTPSTEADPTESTGAPELFVPSRTENTNPENWGIRWEVFDGTIPLASYTRQQPISFGSPENYFALPGIATFRGDNYRSGSTYGYADMTEGTLRKKWDVKTGILHGSEFSGSTWSGSGWTGQPLIVKWDRETRMTMNLYPEKQQKEELVEVIYATLDGRIYFLDLQDGAYTRDPVNVGFAFKGAGSLDPRGYPLLYVGAGDVNPAGQKPRMFIISLIDGSILYEYGHADALALRQDNGGWCAFDSSPLVDAATDTLIWPAESGLLYTIHLNTRYDSATGTISVSPEPPVVARYTTDRSSADRYWYGFEASASIVEHYLYVSENGGMFYCVDLNDMDLVWAQDTKDDSNSSPVYEFVNGQEGYIYTAPSLHWTKDANAQGTISIYKLDALTGEIQWERPYSVHTVTNLSGGVQSTPLLGREGTQAEGLIFYTVARTGPVGAGLLVALDTQTGEEVWRLPQAQYSWSSPTAVYATDGRVALAVCDTGGNLRLVDGATGTELSCVNLGGTVLATPAVYEDMLVVGARSSTLWGVKIQ